MVQVLKEQNDQNDTNSRKNSYAEEAYKNITRYYYTNKKCLFNFKLIQLVYF